MKKFVHISILFFLVTTVLAQNKVTPTENEQEVTQDTMMETNVDFRYATYTPRTRHYFSIDIGAGLGSYLISTNQTNVNTSSNLGVGQNISFDYKYFFNNYVGFGLGVGMTHLNASVNANSYFERKLEGGNYEVDYSLFHHQLISLKEAQDVMNIKVPLHLNFRTRVNYQSSFHFAMGAALVVPIYTTYKYKSGVYDITRDEYQNGECITQGNPFTAHGHDVDKIMGVSHNDLYGKSGSFNLKKINCDIFADLGFLYNPTRTFGLYFGLYASYGVTNTKKNNENDFIYDTEKDEHISVYDTKILKSLHTIEAGAKIGFNFCLKNKSERDEVKYLEEESQRMMEEQQRITDSLQALLQSAKEDYEKLSYIDSVTDFKKSLFVSTQNDVKMLIYAFDKDSAFKTENESSIENGTLNPTVVLFKQNVFSLGEEKLCLQYVMDEEGTGYELTRKSKIALRYFKSLLNARNTSIVRYSLLDVKPTDEKGNFNKEYINKSNAILNDFLDNGIRSAQLEMEIPQPGQKQEDSLNVICNIFDYGICSPMGSLAFYFNENDKIVISDDAKKTLKRLVDRIKRNGDIQINIVGNYNDSKLYSQCYNKALKRAKAFKQLLVENGLNKKDINCYSRANKVKIATDKNNPNRPLLNNRMEIEVYRK